MPAYRTTPIDRGSGLQALLDLSNRFPADNLRRTDLPYRLSSWALDDPANTCLWFDPSGSLAAWAVMQSPFWTIDYALDPASSPDLHRQILAWADARVRGINDTPYGHPSWYVTVFSDQMERIRDLEALGFQSQADVGEDSWSKVWMARPGALPVRDYRVPEGFTIRPLDGIRETPAYVDLHRAVFESKNMTLAWRERTLEAPGHRPDLDLVVTAPDGRLAAFCVCWLNQEDGEIIGQVEPLGCHPDYRQYALGRLALAEGLRRLQDCGARRIYVETDNYRNTAMRLYESVGFEVIRDILIFRKNY